MARGSRRSRLTGVVGFLFFFWCVCDLCRAPSAVRTSTLAAFFFYYFIHEDKFVRSNIESGEIRLCRG